MKLISVTFLRLIGLTALLAVILTAQVSPAQSEWQKKVIKDINDSKFEEAKTYLQGLGELSPEESLFRDWYYELMRRIRIEFPFTEDQIKAQLAEAGYETDDAKLRYWESKKYLEMRPIDGVRYYFKNAVPNLPRLDPELQKSRVVTEYDKQNSAFRLSNCERIIEQSQELGLLSQGRRNVFTCVAKIPANTIPEGEVVRYWAPFPREGGARQVQVKLLYADGDVWKLSPTDELQRTLYMEKKAVKGQDTIFKFSFETTSYAQYFSQQELIDSVKPYDVESELYKKYTAERLPHMVLSDEVRAWAKSIVGDETNPVKMTSLIFDKIDATYPWASSNEYGTMTCIPEYVLREGHGDCGMLTLLLVSACRSLGIPAKWQSGWTVRENSNVCGMHDWGEVYYEGIGWVPIDMSYGLMKSDKKEVRDFYKSALDQYRLVINDSIGEQFFIPKQYFRSEPVDLQKGEIEWNGDNLYFDKWTFEITCEKK